MQTISSELAELRKELASMTARCEEYHGLYDRAGQQIDSLSSRLEQEIEINQRYREWFTKHKSWVAQHNLDIEYKPTEW
jgi:chromosome segregation ATPase